MRDRIEFIKEQIRFIVKKLNENKINYYIVGAIGAYIDAGLEIQRVHDDLDIMIEEKDIEKVMNIFKNSDYSFYDNRFDNNRYLNKYGYPEGEHEVYAMYKDNIFHIGFFLYSYDKEKYTIRDYFKEGDKFKCLERSLPIEIFKFQYNDNCVFENLLVKVVRKELIYKNKKVMNREKDLFDINNLEKKLDYAILDKLKGLSKIRKTKIIEV